MESLETLNQRLADFFGTDDDTRQPIFRIVWSDDQVEKRRVDTLDSGITLLFPEVRDVKKYPYIHSLYVLERLVIVPDENQPELLVKKSYEPIWTYCDAERNPLPPIWPATKLVIDTLYAAIGKTSLAKYIDSEKNTTEDGRQQRITELQAELFGDETHTGDALRYKEGIVVPPSYTKSGE